MYDPSAVQDSEVVQLAHRDYNEQQRGNKYGNNEDQDVEFNINLYINQKNVERTKDVQVKSKAEQERVRKNKQKIKEIEV